jgi:methionine-rich copper-binding protein CopC
MRRKYLAVTSLFLALLTSPAQAHDLLIEITPAAGEVVTSSNFQATLTFNNDLLSVDGQQNAGLETKLSGTEQWISHEVLVDGLTLTAQVQLTESGTHDLRWKVVSSDGHVITGESSIVLELPAAAKTSEPLVAVAPVSEQDPEIPSGFYVGLAMVALGAVFAPIGLMMRRKAKKS